MDSFAVTFLGLAAGGLSYAMLGFPLAWVAMPKSMRSETFGGSKWGYLAAMVDVPLLTGLGFFGLKDTPEGVEPSAVAPVLGIMVCVLFVYLCRFKKTKKL